MTLVLTLLSVLGLALLYALWRRFKGPIFVLLYLFTSLLLLLGFVALLYGFISFFLR